MSITMKSNLSDEVMLTVSKRKPTRLKIVHSVGSVSMLYSATGERVRYLYTKIDNCGQFRTCGAIG